MAGAIDMAKMMQEELRRARAADKSTVHGPAASDASTSTQHDTAGGLQQNAASDTEDAKHNATLQLPDAALPTQAPTVGIPAPTFEFKPPSAELGDLEAQWEIPDAPPCVSYVPDFLTREQSTALLQCVYHAANEAKWVQLNGRRLQNWGGLPQAGGGLADPEPLPPWLAALCDGLVTQGVFAPEHRPNHVLINEYAPGEGIMPHTDGPLYTPQVATISLGDPAYFQLTPRRGTAGPASAAVPVVGVGVSGGATAAGQPPSTLVVLQGSLVVFREEAYSHWEHSVLGTEEVHISEHTANVFQLGDGMQGRVLRREATRVSLTVRHVP